MRRNTSVSLGDYFEQFVDEKISQGRFKNASEVIRAGLRLLEEEEAKVLALKNHDPHQHLADLKKEKNKNG
jgi:antitoxin ParD1/3/4